MRGQSSYFADMKKFFVVCFLLMSIVCAAESEPLIEASPEPSTTAVENVSLKAETCPADSVLSANYAKCKQALTIAIDAQIEKQKSPDRSMQMASAAGTFVGGILLGLLFGWWLL